MKVILLTDHEKLGQQGDVVTVRPGYARNYLVPRGLAIMATRSNLKNLSAQLASAAKRAQRDKDAAVQLGQRLEGQAVTIGARTGVEGRLFGSVTAQQIVAAIKDQIEVNVDRRQVHLPEPLRQTGTHPVELRLHPDVRVEINVEVVSTDG